MSVTATGLPVALPNTGFVQLVCPEAVSVIDRFNQLEASLPPRPSAEELNDLDALRSEAVGLLMDAEVQQNLEELRRTRRRKMRELLGELTTLWRQEETSLGFEKWRRTPTSFRPARGAGMPVKMGNGYNQEIPALVMLAALERLVRGA